METEEEEDVAVNKKAKSEEEEEGNKKQKTEEDELKNKLAELEKNLAAVDEELKVIRGRILKAIDEKDEKMEEKLEKQQTELNQQQANFQERIKDVKQKLVDLKSFTVELKLSLPPEGNQPLSFVESVEFRYLKNGLKQMCHQIIPTNELRELKYFMVRGPIGVGKTRSTWKAVTDVNEEMKNEFLPCFVRLDNVLQNIKLLHLVTREVDVLAAVLLFAFTGRQTPTTKCDLKSVGSMIINKWGKKKILLHLDEYQTDLEIARKIRLGCKASLLSASFGVSVIPIFSGIHDYGQMNEGDPIGGSTSWLGIVVQLGGLPMDSLEQAFADALEKLPIERFQKCKNLVALFRDCGGYAHLVVKLVESIKAEPGLLKKIKKSGVLLENDAIAVFNRLMELSSSVYGAYRWHLLFSSVPSSFTTDETARARELFTSKTEPSVNKMVLLALSKRHIPLDFKLTELHRGDGLVTVTVKDCEQMGVIGTTQIPRTNEIQVVNPLMAILVMNRIGKAIPNTTELENPFLNDWQTLERVAMLSVYVQVAARDDLPQFPILDLRPGALDYFNDCIDILSCSNLEFKIFSTGLTAKKLESGGSPSMLVESLEMGQFWITAPNQAGVDGLAVLNGKVNGDDECTILWLSQSKKQDMSLETGENSGSSLTNGPIRDKLIPKMRKIADQLKKRFPDLLKDAYVVYDIFTDRFGPGSENDKKDSQAQVKTRGRKKVSNNQDVGKIIEYKPSDFGLKKREGLFITRNKHLDSVLAGLAARKRLIEN